MHFGHTRFVYNF
ncbi:MAG: hypothetical protein M1542_07330 [Thermotogae bacterium]|nr:hypothetical protein [Thermotogota bacterium]MCL5033035.1 hypothetical protein [Thermotogota bacterium]